MATAEELEYWREEYELAKDEWHHTLTDIKRAHQKSLEREKGDAWDRWAAAFGQRLKDAGLTTTESQYVFKAKDWTRTKKFLGDSAERRKPGRPSSKPVEVKQDFGYRIEYYRDFEGVEYGDYDSSGYAIVGGREIPIKITTDYTAQEFDVVAAYEKDEAGVDWAAYKAWLAVNEPEFKGMSSR